jgi:hypothetical protein
MRQLGQSFRNRVVESDTALIDEAQQQRRHLLDGDCAVAKVHVRRRRDTRHRLAVPGEQRSTVVSQLHDGGAQIMRGNEALHGVIDPSRPVVNIARGGNGFGLPVSQSSLDSRGR